MYVTTDLHNYNLNQKGSNSPYVGLPDLHLGSDGAHLYQVPAGLDHLGRSRYVAELPTCFRVRYFSGLFDHIFVKLLNLYPYEDQFRMTIPAVGKKSETS